MPYYLHDKTLAPETLDSLELAALHLPEFYTARDGQSAITDRTRQALTYVPTEDETDQWRSREYQRFTTGEYFRTPWREHDRYPLHYAHLSVKTPGMIAYTKNAEHGYLDRQTAIKPGRYLQEFYPDVFDRETVADFIGKCNAEYLTLQFAVSADDIETVYTGGVDIKNDDRRHQHAPTSCMSYDRREYRSDTHPVRAYGDSDLAIAYYGPITSCNARAIVWRQRMRYGRIYGNEHVLRSLLEDAGFTSGSMSGAKIRAIEEDNGRYLMPYVDGISRADLDGDYIRLGSGDMDCSVTSGITEYDDRSDYRECNHCGNEYDSVNDGDSDHCQSCLDDRNVCEHCDREWFGESDYGSLCESCADLHYCCEHCSSDCYSDDDAPTQILAGRYEETWCSDCVKGLERTCEIDDCGETWVEETLDRSEQDDRQDRHLDKICPDCAIGVRYCEHCENYADVDDPRCEHCDHAARCEHTIDLPLEHETVDVEVTQDAPTMAIAIDCACAICGENTDGNSSRCDSCKTPRRVRYALQLHGTANDPNLDVWSQCFTDSPIPGRRMESISSDREWIDREYQRMSRLHSGRTYRIIEVSDNAR